MEEQNAAERRAFKRVIHAEPVQLQLTEYTPPVGSLAKDLSEGGLRLRINEFIPLGTEISVNVQLAPGKLVESTAEVVWISQIPHSESYQVGLEFQNLNSLLSSRQEIHTFIDSN